MTLDHILKINNIKPGFEFLSIDIEGHEIEMFKGFSIEIWRPQLIMLEDHVTNHKKHNHMTKNNYQLIMRTGLNSWYVPRSENYTLSLLSKLEFFRNSSYLLTHFCPSGYVYALSACVFIETEYLAD